MQGLAIRGAAFAVAVAASALVVSGTASAGGEAKGPPKVCPSKALCVFSSDNFMGDRVVVRRKGISNKIAEQMDDATSSVVNTRGKVSRLYKGKNANGGVFCVNAHAAVPSVGPDFNDTASSSKLTTKIGCPF
jgi:Peptidase inhibitor family I36